MRQSIRDTPMCRTSIPVQLWLIYLYTGRIVVSVGGIRYLEPRKTVIPVAIRRRATVGHFLIWMRTVGQLRHADYRDVFMLNYSFYQWTRQRVHSALIVVDQYLRRMGDKTIPDSVESRLESFHPPFVAGIDVPHSTDENVNFLSPIIELMTLSIGIDVFDASN